MAQAFFFSSTSLLTYILLFCFLFFSFTLLDGTAILTFASSPLFLRYAAPAGTGHHLLGALFLAILTGTPAAAVARRRSFQRGLTFNPVFPSIRHARSSDAEVVQDAR